VKIFADMPERIAAVPIAVDVPQVDLAVLEVQFGHAFVAVLVPEAGAKLCKISSMTPPFDLW